MSDKPITVTRPSLPDLNDLQPLLEEIWKSGHITNGGPFHAELEARLCEYLGVKHLSLFANGTLALVTGMQALGLTGEVITTPYTFAATPHSLIWNNLKPVFVDVEPDGFNLDPAAIEAAITSKTTAIVPVHCYGTPANMRQIQDIANSYGLQVLYDAAQAFGVRYEGRSVLEWGDASALSFHATKVFNTFEGGALILKDRETKERVDQLKNFGIVDESTVFAAGINGKMNELQAAVGLLQLQKVNHDIQSRQRIYRDYSTAINGIEGLKLMPEPVDTHWNYSYCPVLVEDEFPLARDELYSEFRKRNILVRRYFYPLVSEFSIYHNPEAIYEQAERASKRVICLPIYSEMDGHDFDRVIACLQAVLKDSVSEKGRG
ncbi:DegT/DnrJ/EryC1/StrS family aminotransferase [Marinobacter xestospongiae]|uniref:DegT/DnrJ/EryC1/StrS family aminotransferase n=1 Tax=Marinobacter xestospongiae TaxID=994319 RepID=UPI0020043595|nr:DegT/DnrJ/EryC1/StrS family aminotransferase [Marinobacter xestospongiae]MCK7568873.1 DegT/DnrJ/EryC1/StrS family aminotransferase [Marinobacter xestospongiae]